MPVLNGAGTLKEVDEDWEIEDLMEYADIQAIKTYMESNSG